MGDEPDGLIVAGLREDQISRTLELMQIPIRGRLLDRTLAPAKGELVEPLVHLGETAIEQILSGELDEPVITTRITTNGSFFSSVRPNLK